MFNKNISYNNDFDLILVKNNKVIRSITFGEQRSALGFMNCASRYFVNGKIDRTGKREGLIFRHEAYIFFPTIDYDGCYKKIDSERIRLQSLLKNEKSIELEKLNKHHKRLINLNKELSIHAEKTSFDYEWEMKFLNIEQDIRRFVAIFIRNQQAGLLACINSSTGRPQLI